MNGWPTRREWLVAGRDLLVAVVGGTVVIVSWFEALVWLAWISATMGRR